MKNKKYEQPWTHTILFLNKTKSLKSLWVQEFLPFKLASPKIFHLLRYVEKHIKVITKP
jgi:hypothetical protein